MCRSDFYVSTYKSLKWLLSLSLSFSLSLSRKTLLCFFCLFFFVSCSSSFLLLWSAVLIMYPTTLAVIALTFSNYVLQPAFQNCLPPYIATRLLATICICESLTAQSFLRVFLVRSFFVQLIFGLYIFPEIICLAVYHNVLSLFPWVSIVKLEFQQVALFFSIFSLDNCFSWW